MVCVCRAWGPALNSRRRCCDRNPFAGFQEIRHVKSRGYLRPLGSTEAEAWLSGELCPADAACIWIKSPAGWPVEVRRDSWEHRLCVTVRPVLGLINSCSPLIVAEALAKHEMWPEYRAHIARHQVALVHMCNLDESQLHHRDSTIQAISIARSTRAGLQTQTFLDALL